MTLFTKSFVSTDKQAGTAGIWPLRFSNMGNAFHRGTIAKTSLLHTNVKSEEVSDRPKFLRLDSTGDRRNDMDFNEAYYELNEPPAVDDMASSTTVLTDRINSIVHQLCLGVRYQPYSKLQRKGTYRDRYRISNPSLTDFCQDFLTKMNLSVAMETPTKTVTPCIKDFLKLNGRHFSGAKSKTCAPLSESTAADVIHDQVYMDHDGVLQSDTNQSNNQMSQPLHDLQNGHMCVVDGIVLNQNVENQSETEISIKTPEVTEISETIPCEPTSSENFDPDTGDTEGVCDSYQGNTVSEVKVCHSRTENDNKIHISDDISVEIISDQYSSCIEQSTEIISDSCSHDLFRKTDYKAANIDESSENLNGLDKNDYPECNPDKDTSNYSGICENEGQSSSIQSDISKLTECDTTESLLSEVAHRLSASSLVSTGSSVCFNEVNNIDSQDEISDDEFTGRPTFQVGSYDDSDSDWSHDSDFDELDGDEASENDKLWNSFLKNDPFSRIPCCSISTKKPPLLRSASSPDILSGGSSPRYSTPRSKSPPPPPFVQCNYSTPLYQTDRQDSELDFNVTPNRKLERTSSNNYSAPHLNMIEKSDNSFETTPKKKVRFAEEEKLVSVHTMVTWNYAYKACRKGPWEEYARDRCRFNRKIEEIGNILSPCLTPEHRHSVYEKLNCTF